ncbi:hypothetical protein Vadar_028391 [Vaccinium darrowii]|uniref:Uncharacterized protein n=1 Tax=Vaccinium darrowii TaxID=229202 RepID=A0ACB7XTW3_9ERIC|nr:hypothetical protein Vadar_028391 [Vaccinium darrowii]
MILVAYDDPPMVNAAILDPRLREIQAISNAFASRTKPFLSFGDEFSDGVAREAAVEEVVEDWTVEGALFGWEEEGVEGGFLGSRESERDAKGFI